jgi:hypothetical protein
VSIRENPCTVLGMTEGSLDEKRKLVGLKTNCLGLQVLDHRNLVAGLSSDSEIFLWDILTGLCLM